MPDMSGIDLEAYEDEWDDDAVESPPRGRPQRDPERVEGLPVGRVIGIHKGWVDVLLDGSEIEAVYGGAMRGESVVVGDRVSIRPARRETDTARVVDRLDRQSVLMRTGDDAMPDDERTLAANIDCAVAVVGPDDPEVGARFIDRVLVAAEAGGLDGIVCLNKKDLLDPGEDPPLLGRYESLGYAVVRTSALTGEGIDELKRLLEGRWSVLAGHSGVGKTSVTNRLIPGSDREIGEVGRHGGRHTTVSPRAMRVPGLDDAWVVDTPGVRSFGIAHVPVDDLWWTFRELRDLDCEMPGCLHDDEPGCAVPDLLGETINPVRYDSYRRFLDVLRPEG